MNLRFQACIAASRRQPVPVHQPAGRPAVYFGKYVFSDEKMRRYLPQKAYSALRLAIRENSSLGRDVADIVANGMKKWAMEMGATHCTHWFQPLTEGTAEKHDAFLELAPNGNAIENFTGSMLVQQEPDASSFPSGGIRSTFEARGYTAWDPASPVFIIGDTLMIPTIFIAYTGEALDYKAPLKKSLSSLNTAATAVARLFDSKVKSVRCNLGWEQEYFLVDEDLFSARPDLVLTGRTLMGHSSAKDQQMDDHYFSAIPDRVQAFMSDLEIRAHELGIPLKTRHNEVAPNQFEVAPVYEECNLSVDHNMLLMSLMRRTARKHGFQCLLHEKPFAGVNGSGKHENWSLQTDAGTMLLAPGQTAEENLRFAVFVVETLMGVWKHNGLLKASIMSATNEHRLGAGEAPPAIISAFIGKQLEAFLDHIETNPTEALFSIRDKRGVQLDIPQIPKLIIHETDRNRTSPFAFTGNRFEFRAVGSSANCASALIVINTAVAEALTSFSVRVEKRGGGIDAVLETLREDIRASKSIRFSGNGYSDEWQQEAKQRGLDCEKNTTLVYDRYLDEDSVQMFESMSVMNRNELIARNEIKWETYHKKIQIEARVMGDLCLNHIIPVATRYQTALVDNVCKINQVYDAAEAAKLCSYNKTLISQINEYLNHIATKTEEMNGKRKVVENIENEREKAIAYHDVILPLLHDIRFNVDKLELIVEDEAWPLPKYRELMFIR